MSGIIQQTGNITCDFIKSNKGISHEAVVGFMREVIRELKKADDSLIPQSVNFLDPPNYTAKSLHITMDK